MAKEIPQTRADQLTKRIDAAGKFLERADTVQANALPTLKRQLIDEQPIRPTGERLVKAVLTATAKSQRAQETIPGIKTEITKLKESLETELKGLPDSVKEAQQAIQAATGAGFPDEIVDELTQHLVTIDPSKKPSDEAREAAIRDAQARKEARERKTRDDQNVETDDLRKLGEELIAALQEQPSRIKEPEVGPTTQEQDSPRPHLVIEKGTFTAYLAIGEHKQEFKFGDGFDWAVLAHLAEHAGEDVSAVEIGGVVRQTDPYMRNPGRIVEFIAGKLTPPEIDGVELVTRKGLTAKTTYCLNADVEIIEKKEEQPVIEKPEESGQKGKEWNQQRFEALRLLYAEGSEAALAALPAMRNGKPFTGVTAAPALQATFRQLYSRVKGQEASAEEAKFLQQLLDNSGPEEMRLATRITEIQRDINRRFGKRTKGDAVLDPSQDDDAAGGIPAVIPPLGPTPMPPSSNTGITVSGTRVNASERSRIIEESRVRERRAAEGLVALIQNPSELTFDQLTEIVKGEGEEISSSEVRLRIFGAIGNLRGKIGKFIPTATPEEMTIWTNLATRVSIPFQQYIAVEKAALDKSDAWMAAQRMPLAACQIEALRVIIRKKDITVEEATQLLQPLLSESIDKDTARTSLLHAISTIEARILACQGLNASPPSDLFWDEMVQFTNKDASETTRILVELKHRIFIVFNDSFEIEQYHYLPPLPETTAGSSSARSLVKGEFQKVTTDNNSSIRTPFMSDEYIREFRKRMLQNARPGDLWHLRTGDQAEILDDGNFHEVRPPLLASLAEAHAAAENEIPEYLQNLPLLAKITERTFAVPFEEGFTSRIEGRRRSKIIHVAARAAQYDEAISIAMISRVTGIPEAEVLPSIFRALHNIPGAYILSDGTTGKLLAPTTSHIRIQRKDGQPLRKIEIIPKDQASGKQATDNSVRLSPETSALSGEIIPHVPVRHETDEGPAITSAAPQQVELSPEEMLQKGINASVETAFDKLKEIKPTQRFITGADISRAFGMDASLLRHAGQVGNIGASTLPKGGNRGHFSHYMYTRDAAAQLYYVALHIAEFKVLGLIERMSRRNAVEEEYKKRLENK